MSENLENFEFLSEKQEVMEEDGEECVEVLTGDKTGDEEPLEIFISKLIDSWQDGEQEGNIVTEMFVEKEENGETQEEADETGQEERQDGTQHKEEEKMNSLEDFKIEAGLLDRLVFRERLAVVHQSDPNTVVGTFSVNVSKLGQCLLVHVSGTAVTKEEKHGISVTSCVDTNMFTIEEKQYEYTKEAAECRMYFGSEGTHYFCTSQVNADKVMKLIPMAETKHLVGEGANIILQRQLALRGFHGTLTFSTILGDGQICPTTYTCERSTVAGRGGQDVTVTVIEQVIEESQELKRRIRTMLTCTGGLLQYEWLDGSFLARVSEPDWQDDMQLKSHYLDQKTRRLASHKSYCADRPEVRALIADFMQAVLLQKPEDAIQFAIEHFSLFAEEAQESSSDVISAILDDVVKASVQKAERDKMADLIRKLVTFSAKADRRERLMKLLDEMAQSAVKVSQILHMLVRSDQHDIAELLPAVLTSAVQLEGDKVTDILRDRFSDQESMELVRSATEGEEVVADLLRKILNFEVRSATEGEVVVADLLRKILNFEVRSATEGEVVVADLLRTILNFEVRSATEGEEVVADLLRTILNFGDSM